MTESGVEACWGTAWVRQCRDRSLPQMATLAVEVLGCWRHWWEHSGRHPEWVWQTSQELRTPGTRGQSVEPEVSKDGEGDSGQGLVSTGNSGEQRGEGVPASRVDPGQPGPWLLPRTL